MGRPKSAQKATPKNKRAPFRLSLKFPQKPSKPTIASENGAEDFGKETKQVESGQEVMVVQDLPVQKKLSETREEVLMSPGKKVLIKRVGAHNPIRKSKDLLLMKAVVMLTRLDTTLLQNDMINALNFERSNTKENAQSTKKSSIVTVEPEPDVPMALELSDISVQSEESPEVPAKMVDPLVTFTDKNSTVSTVVLDEPNPDEGDSVPDMANSITSVSDVPARESSGQQTVSGASLEPSSSSRCVSTSDSAQGDLILPTIRPGPSKKKKMANQRKPELFEPSFSSRCESTSVSAQEISILPKVRPDSSKNKMASQQKSETVRDSGSVMTSNCDLFHGLLDRVYLEPPTGKLCNLQSNPHMRQVAPYAMRAGPTSDEYFQYVAVVAEEDDAKFCCVVFGLVEQCLSAFSGHFRVPKERLFDPVNGIPASEIAVLSSERSRLHMGLFGVPNKTLIGYDGYFVQGGRGSYAGVVSQFLEMFMSAVDQVRLKEKTKCEVALACGSGNRHGAPRDVLRRVSSNRVVKRKAVSRLRRSFVEVPMDPLRDF